jgi:large subunit ribosomal protein L23
MNSINQTKNNNNLAQSLNKMIDLIKYPVLNYKTYKMLNENKQYTFDVDLRLSKPQIKKLFEYYFSVNVTQINTQIHPRKKRLYISTSQGYKTRYKRVIIQLKKDQSIAYVDILMTGFLKQMLQKLNSQKPKEE